MQNRKIPPAKPFFPMEDREEILSAVGKILESGMLTLGSYTKEFEKEFAKVSGVSHAVAVNSGTSAIEIALRALDVKQGDEIIVPTNTFTATAAAAWFSGAKPVLVDIHGSSLCIDLTNVKKAISNRTAGVIAVHIGGVICPQISEIRDLCREKGLFLVEDAAHAQGCTADGRAAGSFGNAGCFSFYPTKVITTGEGGMITTNSESVANKAKVLRDQGKESFESNKIVAFGYNWRMQEISAAIGLTQLRRLQEIIEARNRSAEIYDQELLSKNRMDGQEVPKGQVVNRYKYTAFVKRGIDRDEFKRRLAALGARCGGEVYWPPCHLQPAYQEFLGVRAGEFPVAEDYCARMVCLPMYTQLTAEDAQYVAGLASTVLRELA